MPGVIRQPNESAAVPRFSGPREPCPTSRLTGFAKQVDRRRLSSAEGAVLDAFFGGFLTEVNPPGDAHQALRRLGEQRGLDTEYDERLPRRYDGDHTLPRGCYSTLCADAAGDDGGTFVQEMIFYANPTTSAGHVEVFDPAMPLQRDRIVSLGMSPDAGERVVVRFLSFDQPEGAREPVGIVTSVQVEIREIVVDGVLDLRRPAAARWLARTIPSLTFEAGGERFPCYPSRPGIETFEELLPSVLDQAKGGGNFHRIVGLYLRQLGVSGLVFPSVRGDISVRYRDGEVEASRGWTFVDYRTAPPARQVVFFELRPQWPRGLLVEAGDDHAPNAALFGDEIEVRVEGLAEGTGGWSVSGLSRRLGACQLLESARAAMRFRLPGVNADAVTSVIAFTASLPVAQAAQVASMTLYSLLGLQRARDDLHAFVDANASVLPAPEVWRACADPPPLDPSRAERSLGLAQLFSRIRPGA